MKINGKKPSQNFLDELSRSRRFVLSFYSRHTVTILTHVSGMKQSIFAGLGKLWKRSCFTTFTALRCVEEVIVSS